MDQTKSPLSKLDQLLNRVADHQIGDVTVCFRVPSPEVQKGLNDIEDELRKGKGNVGWLSEFIPHVIEASCYVEDDGPDAVMSRDDAIRLNALTMTRLGTSEVGLLALEASGYRHIAEGLRTVTDDQLDAATQLVLDREEKERQERNKGNVDVDAEVEAAAQAVGDDPSGSQE